jgi:hypothetical protein
MVNVFFDASRVFVIFWCQGGEFSASTTKGFHYEHFTCVNKHNTGNLVEKVVSA